MTEWKLMRTNNTPVVLDGKRLWPPHSGLGGANFGSALFLTTSGRYVLHASDRHQSYPDAQYAVHLDADKMTTFAIIEALGGYHNAKEILVALGRSTEERIE